MATLTNQEFRSLRDTVWRLGQGKEEFKALTGGLPQTTKIRDAFQAIEDSMLSTAIPAGAVGLTVLQIVKIAFDNALGKTSSNALFNFCFKAWFIWKANI